MTNTFNIHYDRQLVSVIPVIEAAKKICKYILHFNDRTRVIYSKEDNEGASHWFEENLDKETPFAKEIGSLISVRQN